ncbi:MAG TPA: Mur ligase family protein, partial [Aquella sp.]|nr:Mur ligase family protein [Aquella sp.]
MNSHIFNALNNPGNAKIVPGTDRIKQVLNLLNNPQNKYKVIHITGSNGKGSTAAFIETGLCHAGYKVGKFSSPHIKVINECILLNGQQITDSDLRAHFYQVQQVLDNHSIHLSPFELLTAIMFNYFASCSIDYLVLEVGMGGEGDATNVYSEIAENVLISIITNISLEHTAFLGNTLADIAKAKAGIIKNGHGAIPASRHCERTHSVIASDSVAISALTIIADNTPELIDAVENKTQNYINILNHYDFTVTLDYDKFQTIVEINNKEVYVLNLFGKFQAYNFLCAYHALNHLKIAKQSINYAALNTRNPGRLEIKERNPLLILDASHNLAGVKPLADTFNKKFNRNDVVIITAILADKDVTNMLKEFSAIAS